MQESVTLTRIKIPKKRALKPVIFISLFFLIIFFISAILVVSKRSNMCFEARTYYIVYADKNKNSDLLFKVQKNVKDLGGAGVMFEKNNEYYVAISVYNNKDDAKEIAGKLIAYEKSGVIEYVCKSVSNNYRNQIRENQNYYNLFKFLYDFLIEYETLCYKYVKAEISEGIFISTLISFKVEIEKMIEMCNEDKNDGLQKIIDSAKVIVFNAETLMNKFYSSNTKESLCFEFCVNLCMQQISLCDNLQ